MKQVQWLDARCQMTEVEGILDAIATYATAYEDLQRWQETSNLIPQGDQKTGCIGEFYVRLYLRARFPNATFTHGSLSETSMCHSPDGPGDDRARGRIPERLCMPHPRQAALRLKEHHLRLGPHRGVQPPLAAGTRRGRGRDCGKSMS